MHVIYRHRSRTSGKSYVGLTPKRSKLDIKSMSKEEIEKKSQRAVDLRWDGHIAAMQKGSSLAFHNAIRKYGKDDFEHEVLEICESLDEAFESEKRWISESKSSDREFGYNMTIGGDGVILTPKDRLRQKEATKQAMWRPDVRTNHLAAQSNPETRKKKSKSALSAWSREDVREKHKLAFRTSEKVAKFRRPVIQIDPSTAIEIAQYESIRAAVRATGIPKSTLQSHLAGNLKAAGGYLWKYVIFPERNLV